MCQEVEHASAAGVSIHYEHIQWHANKDTLHLPRHSLANTLAIHRITSSTHSAPLIGSKPCCAARPRTTMFFPSTRRHLLLPPCHQQHGMVNLWTPSVPPSLRWSHLCSALPAGALWRLLTARVDRLIFENELL
ncbi:uncharacterized protein LOC124554938 isoform X1 [Schistocerca americana]|uniref:uncharacterized protein LOC124554938 isoform X1 n=1 Tax=Schistocerca americana TaxID=7009 RepID=UPI001F4FF4BF|nr:uncharacterized protein LOC124554938 isoform X1 [Schistocerca americana]